MKVHATQSAFPSALEAIGNTPMVQLQRILPEGCGRVFVKLEWYNPTGSKKDRMALAMIEGAEKRGDLKPGMTVVEFSGGSTGAGLAFVCGVKGYRFRLISGDPFGKEKIDMMRALGAEVEILKSEDGKISKSLVQAMIARAKEIAQDEDVYWTNQLTNSDVPEGFIPLGEEILSQLDGNVDAVCDTIGTSGTLIGIAKAFKQANHKALLVALEPASSPILTAGRSGSHHVDGVGLGFIPDKYDARLVDRALAIEEEEARAICRELAQKEGLFLRYFFGHECGGSHCFGSRIRPRLYRRSCGLRYRP
jgi:cysteine synthase